MAQTKRGALKIAAGRRGITVHQYLRKVKDGFKWCSGCKLWHLYIEFGLDSSRNDGLSTVCLKYRKIMYEKSYKQRPRKKGRKFVDPRDGDKKQARRRINHLVDIGLMPRPSTLICIKCNGYNDSKRNEYHHHNGYGVDHHEDVIVLCSSCHAGSHKNSKKG